MAEVTVPGRTPGGHYSFAATHDGWIVTAGHLPVRPDGTHTSDLGFEEQVRQAFENLFATLSAAGAGSSDVLKVTAYIVGVERWTLFNTLFAQAFGEHRPARTVVPVAELHYGYQIELEAMAVTNPRTPPVRSMAPHPDG